MKRANSVLSILALVAIAFAVTSCVTAGTPLNVLSPTQPMSVGGPAPAASPNQLAQATTFTNTNRHFSFTIPAGWEQVSGDVNSDSVSFMRLADSCSFIVTVEPMRKSFPAEAAVKASLQGAKEDIEIGKLSAAKRRDEAACRGWEITEIGKSDGFQRVIYQCYGADNVYHNFIAGAETEKFGICEMDLHSIIDSIKFGD